MLANLPGQAESVAVGKVEVQDDQVRRSLRQGAEHFGSVVRRTHATAFVLEMKGEEGLNHFVVFDD